MGRKTVLIVEDHDYVRESLRDHLEDCDFEVAAAAGGEQALLEVAARRPDVIVTDLMMPGMGGFELIRLVRQMPGCEELPIIALSGLPEAYLEIAEDLGASAALSKGPDLLRLEETINRLLGRGKPVLAP